MYWRKTRKGLKIAKKESKTPESENSQVGTNLGKTLGLFFQGLHPLVEHLDEPFQEAGPAALTGTDIDKGVVIIAQVHIVEVFEM